MAYNRTLQQSGRTNRIRPMEEWIVSVGKHPFLILYCHHIMLKQIGISVLMEDLQMIGSEIAAKTMIVHGIFPSFSLDIQNDYR